jgi:hypothetical protein
MEKKRSRGVTLVGWLAIVMGIFGILGSISPRHYFAMMGNRAFSYLGYAISMIFSVATLSCGIYILKLKTWARKLAIVLCAVSIITILIQYNPKQAKLIADQAYSQQEQTIREEYKPEYQEKALERLRQAKLASDKIFPIFFFSTAAFAVGLNLLIVYFFTRPKVKEQFS